MSFSIDIDTLFGYASDIINAMMPVILLVGGLGLGFVIVNKIIAAFR